MKRRTLVWVIMAVVLSLAFIPLQATAKMKVNMASSYGPGAPGLTDPRQCREKMTPPYKALHVNKKEGIFSRKSQAAIRVMIFNCRLKTTGRTHPAYEFITFLRKERIWP